MHPNNNVLVYRIIPSLTSVLHNINSVVVQDYSPAGGTSSTIPSESGLLGLSLLIPSSSF